MKRIIYIYKYSFTMCCTLFLSRSVVVSMLRSRSFNTFTPMMKEDDELPRWPWWCQSGFGIDRSFFLILLVDDYILNSFYVSCWFCCCLLKLIRFNKIVCRPRMTFKWNSTPLNLLFNYFFLISVVNSKSIIKHLHSFKSTFLLEN